MRLTVSGVPVSVKLPLRSVVSFMRFLFSVYCCSKRFSDQFFAFLPERLGVIRVERIGTHPFTGRRDDGVVRHDVPDLAVRAIPASDLFSASDHTRPDRSCRSLGNRLPFEGSAALRSQLLVEPINHTPQLCRIHIAAEFSLYDSRMDGRRAHASIPVAPVECDGEEYVRCLRPPIG